jgi:ribosomal protein S27E
VGGRVGSAVCRWIGELHQDFVRHFDPASHDELPIQCPVGSGTGWTRQPHVVTIRRMAREIRIDKLSDGFGQYMLMLKCLECGHERTTEPLTLGRLCGWDARLEDVAKRMRCSKCGKKQCSLRAILPAKPRGYSALPR